MTHPTEDTLNHDIERELSPAEQVRIATHLETCAEWALVVADLQQIVRDASALGPLAPPPHVWALIQARLSQSAVGSRQSTVDSRWTMADGRWARFAWVAATAALV